MVDAVPTVVVVNRRKFDRFRATRGGGAGVSLGVILDVILDVILNIIRTTGGTLGIIKIRLQRSLFGLFGGSFFGVPVLLFTSHKSVTHPIAHKCFSSISIYLRAIARESGNTYNNGT